MASLVEIANAALDLVGQYQIMTLEDSTDSARKAKLHIYDAVREVLGAGKWTSARKSAILSQLATEPDFDWDYRYQLPGDFLGLVRFNDQDPDDIRDTWEIQGRELFTDEEEANLVYICDLTASGNDINAATPLLTECFKLQLAIKLSWVFQQSRTHRESLLAEYERKRNKALARDARENRPKLTNQLSDSSWVRSRYGSTNG